MRHKRMKLSELVEDLSVYPRATVFDGHVRDLMEALRAGTDLPPIIVDSKSKRIVDGFHRARALRKVFGPDHETQVEVRTYKSEGDLFLDAVRLNAHHGRRMSSFDHARVASIADTLGIDPGMVATALSVTADRLSEIRVAKTATAFDGNVQPIRRGFGHMAGRTLTKRQTEAAKSIGGQTPIYHANQLIALLEADAVPEDARLVERLGLLRDLLIAKVPATAEATN